MSGTCLAADPIGVVQAPSARARIVHWLLEGPAQIAHGEHAGAVAGWVDAQGRAGYGYPEITGYYLQWLASRDADETRDLRLAARADAAQRWLVRWAATETPCTRVPLQPADADWRNDALFVFDLAMVLRGLGSACVMGLLVPDAKLVVRLEKLLARCIGEDGAFEACVPLRDGMTLPSLWSTRRGAFLAKAAAGLLTAAMPLGLGQTITGAAAKTLAQSVDAFVRTPHPEVHPLLYACEGMLAVPGVARLSDVLANVAQTMRSIFVEADAAGFVPERRGAHEGPARLDVVAQALRVARLVEAHGADPWPREDTCARWLAHLADRVREDGGVPFAAGMAELQCNAWVAMFAEQALAWQRALPWQALTAPLLV